MNKKEIFKKIGGIIAEITEQYQYLSQDTENINELELEMFIANSHFLGEHLNILQKLNLNSPKVLVPHVEVLNNEPIVDAPVTQHLAAEVPIEVAPPLTESNFIEEPSAKRFDQVFEFENKPIEQLNNNLLVIEDRETIDKIKTEIIIAEVAANVEQTTSVLEEVITEPIELPRETKISLEPANLDQKAPQVLTINDILSGKTVQNESVASQLDHQQTISDVKSIISLNDKLLFIKDLFNGYSLAYSEAIDLVNKANSFEAAEHFLKANYALKNGWSQKQGTVDKLHEIISRKFAK